MSEYMIPLLVSEKEFAEYSRGNGAELAKMRLNSAYLCDRFGVSLFQRHRSARFLSLKMCAQHCRSFSFIAIALMTTA